MSPYWSVEQEQALIDLLDSETRLEDIAQQLNRSVDAVVLKAKRLGVAIPEKCLAKSAKNKVTKSEATTTTSMERLSAIQPAKDLISMQEMLKLFLGALEQLQKPGVSLMEIKRCRTIVSTARSYLAMLKIYERMTELEQWLVNTNAKLLELTRQHLRKTKDPDKKARLQREIAHMERFLEESEKQGYKPFQKKPSLMSEVP